MKGRERPEEKRVIEEFVSYLSKFHGETFSISKWPDETNTKDIDAIAINKSKIKNEKIAIEHTSIDSFPKQREDSAGFVAVFGALESELKHHFEGFIQVTVPVGAVKTKKEQEKIKETFRTWFLGNIPDLPFGISSHKLEGIDFKISKNKRSGEGLFGFCRYDPEDTTLSERIKQPIEEKTKKLKPYGDQGYKKILLIENNDIALMSPDKMYRSLNEALSEPLNNEADEIWYADTSFENNFKFYFFWPDSFEENPKLN